MRQDIWNKEEASYIEFYIIITGIGAPAKVQLWLVDGEEITAIIICGRLLLIHCITLTAV